MKGNGSYMKEYKGSMKENVRDMKENERKIKTSIQGSFTYTDSNLLDERFWKKGMFEYGIDKLEKTLIEIANISKENNSDFYIIIYPWAETLEFGQEKFNWSEFVKKLCVNQCEVINAIPSFMSYKDQNINWSNELYFLNDEHFNEKGASLLYKTVIKNIN